jgi:hypothetical protein
MNQLENQLKRVNPQAYKEFQQAKKENNPQEYYNKVVGGFSPEQRQQWDNFMGQFNTQQSNNGINTQK